jgi:hypothetical protein
MGGRSSKTFHDLDDLVEDRGYDLYQSQRNLQKKMRLPLQVMVSHYTPSNFPLLPIVSHGTTAICRDSWKRIVSTDVPDPYGGPSVSGMTAFYNEFYERYGSVCHEIVPTQYMCYL